MSESNATVNRRESSKIRECLRALFDAALAAADPAKLITGQAIAAHLPQPVAGRTIVVGAGKASAAMACAFEKAWPGPLEGMVSPATAMPSPVAASRLSRRDTRFPTRPGRRRRGASSTSLAGSALRISWCASSRAADRLC